MLDLGCGIGRSHVLPDLVPAVLRLGPGSGGHSAVSARDAGRRRFILLTKTQPIRYAVERAEQNGTSPGEEYFSTAPFSYRTGWNDDITLTKLGR